MQIMFMYLFIKFALRYITMHVFYETNPVERNRIRFSGVGRLQTLVDWT